MNRRGAWQVPALWFLFAFCLGQVSVQGTNLRLSDVIGTTDATVEVPLILEAEGKENSVAFSISFDPAKVSFAGFAPASSLQGGPFLLNSASTVSGRIGIVAGLPVGRTFASGSNLIGRISLKPLAAFNGSLQFSDNPTIREVVGADATPLIANYFGARISAVQRTLRAVDGTAVIGGDFSIMLAEVGDGSERSWSFSLQFDSASIAFGALTPAENTTALVNTNEAASGTLKVLIGVLPGARLASGPNPIGNLLLRSIGTSSSTSPLRFLPASSVETFDSSGRALTSLSVDGRVEIAERRLRLPNVSAEIGEIITVPLQLVGSGSENSLTATLNFDPKQLELRSVTPLPPVSALLLNTNELGKARAVLAAPSGTKIPSGNTPVALFSFLPKGPPGAASLHLTTTGAQDALGGPLSLESVDGSVQVVMPNQPRIVTDPGDAVISAGRAAQFTVIAAGTEPLSYQWLVDSYEIAGATNASFSVTDFPSGFVSPAQVTVRVRNDFGSIFSRGATIELVRAPRILTQTAGPIEVPAGTDVELSVTTEGSAPLRYQWSREGIPVPGAVGSKLRLSNVTADAAGSYRVQVSNGIDPSVLSTPILVSVIEPPKILSAPPAFSKVISGDRFEISVRVQGTPPLSYQWQLNGQNLADQTGPTLIIPAVTRTNAGLYTVRIANRLEAITSDPAELVVDFPPGGSDNLGSAELLSANSGTLSGSNLNATREADEPDHLGKSAGKSMWFKWRSARPGRLALDTKGTSFDSIIAVYKGESVSQLSSAFAGGDDDGGPALTSELAINVQPGTTYSIALDGFRGITGQPQGRYLFSWDFKESPDLLPEILIQPKSTVVPESTTASLGVTASGTGLKYQWFFNNARLPGQTAPRLIIPSASARDVGLYYVEISNANGLTLRSDGAALELGAQPVLSVDKPLQEGAQAAATLLRALATGSQALLVSLGPTISQTYSHAGATSQQFETNSCPAAGGRTKWVKAELKSDGTMTVDASASFAFNLSLRDGNAQQKVLAQSCDGTRHHLEIRVNNGQKLWIRTESADEAIVRLDVNLGEPPVPPTQPQLDEFRIADGTETELTAPITSGIPSPLYFWFRDGSPLAGLSGPKVKVNQTGFYTVIVSNVIGQIKLSVADIRSTTPFRFGSTGLNSTGRSLIFQIAGEKGQAYALSSTGAFDQWRSESEGWFEDTALTLEQPILSTGSRFFRLTDNPRTATLLFQYPDGSYEVRISGGRAGEPYVLERRDGAGPWRPLLTETGRTQSLSFRDTLGGSGRPEYHIRRP